MPPRRSFNTTASGGFSWQTFGGTGSTPSNFVSNVAPYRWYVADVTAQMLTNRASMLVRVKSVNTSLVVNRVELCVDVAVTLLSLYDFGVLLQCGLVKTVRVGDVRV